MNNTLRKDADKIIENSIKAVLPDEAVKRALNDFEHPEGKLILVAAGKAAWQMAAAAQKELSHIDAGIVITKYGHVKGELEGIKCYEAGHPVPDENSFLATRKALDLVEPLGEKDTVLFLLSGGGSALFESPLIPGEELGDITKQLLACGANIVTFHIEAVMDPVQMVRSIHENGMRAGVAIKPATPVSAIEEIINEVDMILIMSVEPGFGGQSFMPVALDKIRETVLLLEEYGLKTDIEVDGGINLKNVDEILEAGANVIVSGSAIFESDITANILSFRKHLEER